MRDRRKNIVWRALAQAIVRQPEPMVGDTLDLVKIVSLVVDLPVLDKEFVDVLPVTVGPPLENLRVLMLKLLVLQPLFAFSPHHGLELFSDQVDSAVEVCGQVHKRLNALVLDILNNTNGVFLHELDFHPQSLHVVLQTLRLCQDG